MMIVIALVVTRTIMLAPVFVMMMAGVVVTVMPVVLLMNVIAFVHVRLYLLVPAGSYGVQVTVWP